MMDDENDPVVYERTVMLSRRLCNNLLLLQYPVCSTERTYDKAHVLATRVKPKQQSVELEFALDAKSSHYSVTGARDTGCVEKQVCRQLDLIYAVSICSATGIREPMQKESGAPSPSKVVVDVEKVKTCAFLLVGASNGIQPTKLCTFLNYQGDNWLTQVCLENGCNKKLS